MIYQLRLLKGICFPSFLSHQLKQAEKIPRLWLRILLLIFSSGMIYFISAYFGIDSGLLSKELTSLSNGDFESIKLFFAIGKMLWGIFFASLILFLPALYFWSLTEIPFTKLVTTQTFVLLILLLEKGAHILLTLIMGINQFSSPLSFGIIIQYFTNNELVIFFFGSISIFHFWFIYVQYTFLKRLTDKYPPQLLLLIISIYLFFLIVSTLLDYIKIERLI